MIAEVLLAILIIVPLILYVVYRNRHVKLAEVLAILTMSIFGFASGLTWSFLGMPHPDGLIGVIIVFLLPMGTIEFMIINKYRIKISWLNLLRIDQGEVFCYFSVGFCIALLI